MRDDMPSPQRHGLTWPRRLGVALLLLAGTACAPQPSEAPPAQATPPIAGPSARTDAADRPQAPAPRDGVDASRGAAVRERMPERNGRRVDLRRDERLGGHTIARHVGRTDAQLKARLARESIAAASTYADLEQAERVVALALAANERRVQRWLDQRGPRSNLAIRYRARDGLPTGRLMQRGDDASVDVSGAVVVLRWRDDAHHVLTSYPEDPR
jgi:hypothetical protein